MVVILGCIVVLGSVLAGFSMAGGHVHALVHPSEIVTIGGAALGALIVMSPKKVLVDLVHGVLHAIKGSPFNKQAYVQLFSVLYDLFRIGRRDGMLAWDMHLSAPEESPLLQKYPLIHGNHHVRDFLCGALQMVSDGRATPVQVETLLEREIKVMEDEHHAAVGALSKTADALPGFGIVAAVLGIVVTMGPSVVPWKRSDTRSVRHLSERSWGFCCRTASLLRSLVVWSFWDRRRRPSFESLSA